MKKPVEKTFFFLFRKFVMGRQTTNLKPITTYYVWEKVTKTRLHKRKCGIIQIHQNKVYSAYGKPMCYLMFIFNILRLHIWSSLWHFSHKETHIVICCTIFSWNTMSTREMTKEKILWKSRFFKEKVRVVFQHWNGENKEKKKNLWKHSVNKIDG